MAAKPGNTAGYFGKLPGFNDFVKFNAGGEELLILDKWLQDGLITARMKLKSEWVNYYKNSEPLFFFNPFTGTGRALTGVLYFSKDKSGREFPFICFVYFDKKQLVNSPFYLIPVILSEILNELKSALNDISSINNLTDLNERLNNISYHSENNNNFSEQYKNFLNNTSQNDFWDRITGNYEDITGLSILINLFQLKESTDCVTLQFLSTHHHFINDLTFLYHIAYSFQTNNDSFNAVFWTAPGVYSGYPADKNHFMHIFKNKLVPDNFINLIKRQDTYFNLIEKQINASIKSSFENILNRDISLKEFLNAIQ